MTDRDRWGGWRGAACLLAGFLLLAIPWLLVLFHASARVDGERYFWLDDDQMISMRYARHVAAGDGPVWNPGERVEGYTNPAWMLTMAAVHLLPLPDRATSVAVKSIALGLGLLVLVLTGRLVRQFVPRPGVAYPAAILGLALTPDLAYFLVNGFETPLLMACFLAAILGVVRDTPARRWSPWTYLALALLPLVRSDAHVLWIAVAILDLGLSVDRPRRLGLLALAALPAVGHEIFRLAFYGSPLPNTYYLKVQGIDGLPRAALGYLWRFFRHYGLFLIIAGVGWARLRDRRYALLGAGLGLQLLAIVRVGGDLFPYSRFLAPWVPVLLAAALAVPVRLGLPLRWQAAVSALAVGAMALQLTTFSPARLASDNGGPEAGTVAGILIERNTSTEASVGVIAAGAVSYFSRRPVIDMLGKSDARIAHAPRRAAFPRGHDKFDFDYVLGRKPDLIVTFFPEETVERHARGEEVRLPYLAALARNPAFADHYLPHPVPVPYLRERNAVYVRDGSPELVGAPDWRQPRIDR
ncbi:MAG: hypothetical protein PVF68_04235 [Acidobacteriota bacterium]|jgi:hypothetical protein